MGHQTEIADEVEIVNLLEGATFSPIQNEILAAARDDVVRKIAICAGRRVGKTRVGPGVVGQWMHQDLEELAVEVVAGERPRWPGFELSRGDAKTIEPDALYWVVAPRDSHLEAIRGFIRQLYMGPGARFLHPMFQSLQNKGRSLWVWHEAGVVGRYDFLPASGEAALVAKGLRGAWVDESGFIGNDRFDVFSPTLWEHGGRLLATGTPALGDGHWFTRLAVSGLPASHERADAAIAVPDPEVRTFIASTTEHAWSPQARRKAAIEAKHRGELWAAIWVYADWRTKGRQVFRSWREGLHVQDYGLGRGGWRLGTQALPSPDIKLGLLDWSGGTAPGAAVAAHVWERNPLAPEDPRHLVVAAADYQGHDAYTDHGWWQILGDLERTWGLEYWIADPHSPHLIKQARRAGLDVREGASQDKMGRLTHLSGLLHHDLQAAPPIRPALYVAKRCTEIPRQAAAYRWKTNRQGQVLDKPIQYDDHCLDCLAMLVSEIDTGAVQIGGQLYH